MGTAARKRFREKTKTDTPSDFQFQQSSLQSSPDHFIFFRLAQHDTMCTIIVTIRTVLWAVMTIAGSLMILVSLFTDRWLIGKASPDSVANTALDGGFFDGAVTDSN